MGEKTEIAWCDSTFNPWIGCQKVSAGCDHCYAETLMDTRYGRVQWGQRKTDDIAPSVGTRVRTTPANWRKPLQWAKAAKATGTRPRVFCSSLADVFDNQVDPNWRADLFELIRSTSSLDWLLLTKRPENIEKMIKVMGIAWPWPNVWLGTTCEDQAAYDRRWDIIKRIPAAIHFISYEPAIGALKIGQNALVPDWLICGGESGRGARMMDPAWARSVRDECARVGTRFFMKQMTGLKPIPDDLMVRQFPIATADPKKSAESPNPSTNTAIHKAVS